MRYLALACDYDGTLAHDSRVDAPTLAALERLRASGRKLILVSGRELEDLVAVFPHTDLFEWLVLENGALLYQPGSRQEKALGSRPPDKFVERLRAAGVAPFSVGRVILATWQPHENAVLAAIRDSGLELQVIFNKGAVMVLPAGVNKATGLAAALQEMGLSPHNVIGVGDAENDHAFLHLCEASAAVANALPAIQEETDLVTRGDHGAGVVELIDELVGTDLARLGSKLTRHCILLGTRVGSGSEVRLRPYDSNVLIAGSSGSGKSTLATGLLERLAESRYQFCVVDPEGDYESIGGAVTLGTSQHGPTVDEVLQLLQHPEANAIVNLVSVPIQDRPLFFLTLLAHVQGMRALTGRPHWLLVDEAHHLLPAAWQPGQLALPNDLDRMVLVTVHPDQVAPAVLHPVDTVVAVGNAPDETFRQFARAAGAAGPAVPATTLEAGEVLIWFRSDREPPFRMRVAPPHAGRRRHSRKYAEGQLPPERCFYFHGPENKLNLRAQNLMTFLQMAEGVDDATWLHHLRRGDYSRWFLECIKDESLADEAARVENGAEMSASDSRAIIKTAVERRYTAPASAPMLMPGTDLDKKRAPADPGTKAPPS